MKENYFKKWHAVCKTTVGTHIAINKFLKFKLHLPKHQKNFACISIKVQGICNLKSSKSKFMIIQIFGVRLQKKYFASDNLSYGIIKRRLMVYPLPSHRKKKKPGSYTLIDLPLSSSSCNAVFSSRQAPISRSDSENSESADQVKCKQSVFIRTQEYMASNWSS